VRLLRSGFYDRGRVFVVQQPKAVRS